MENNNKYLPYKSLKNKTLPINLLLKLLSVKDFKKLYEDISKIEVDINEYNWENILIFRLKNDLEEYLLNNETIRIQINNLYYGQFLLSDIPEFINKKSMHENILFKALNLILIRNGKLSFEDYKKLPSLNNNIDDKKKYDNFRKVKEKLSKILRKIFTLNTDPFIYDNKNKIYNAKFSVEIINEDLDKDNFKRKYSKKNNFSGELKK
ncbi:MAG: hypothetical protein AB7E37_05875 [Candidatus Altimarinota bacterium]